MSLFQISSGSIIAYRFIYVLNNCLTQSLVIYYDQVLESYDRAYSNMVRVQQLSELEEVRINVSTCILLQLTWHLLDDIM